eukprot:3112923-Pyramimonas_sp.AAC.1
MSWAFARVLIAPWELAQYCRQVVAAIVDTGYPCYVAGLNIQDGALRGLSIWPTGRPSGQQANPFGIFFLRPQNGHPVLQR